MSEKTSHPTPAALRSRAGSGFTLVEMLIAVGAVALISVGLARLFASTGDTVRVGRRISTLNEAASTLERQIRKDVASMTREGFLVIRHKNIDGTAPNSGVLLSEDDTGANARNRRADELVFFAAGKFTSMREPVYPTRQAVGNAARIYYGHGVRDRRLEDPTAAGYLLDSDPIVDLDPDTLNNWPELGQAGLNEYASTWALLRHVTVLARPALTDATPPADAPAFASTSTQWRDSVSQIGLQPAAVSIFRLDPLNGTDDILGGGYRTSSNPAVQIALPGQWARSGFAPVYSRFASGVVDVASVDLSFIRNRVLSLPNRVLLKTPGSAAERFEATEIEFALSAANQNESAHLSKMLMASALPSAPVEIDGPPSPTQNPTGSDPEQRMLWAPVPADFTGLVANSTTQRWPANEPWRRQDQIMLTSTPIVVGCTEFIVEWSFGDVSPVNAGSQTTRNTGQLIWHGLSRWEDTDGNGRMDPYETASAGPYRNQNRNTGGGWDGALGRDRYTLITESGFTRDIPAALIHWPTNVAFDSGAGTALTSPLTPLYSFFGYIDPTYRNDPFDAANPTTLQWPWPRLLRFTVTLVDPSDPLAEQTYQFVVELPTEKQ